MQRRSVLNNVKNVGNIYKTRLKHLLENVTLNKSEIYSDITNGFFPTLVYIEVMFYKEFIWFFF